MPKPTKPSRKIPRQHPDETTDNLAQILEELTERHLAHVPDNDHLGRILRPLSWRPLLPDELAAKRPRNSYAGRVRIANTPVGHYFLDYKYNSSDPQRPWCWGFWPARAAEPSEYHDCADPDRALRFAEGHWRQLVRGCLVEDFAQRLRPATDQISVVPVPADGADNTWRAEVAARTLDAFAAMTGDRSGDHEEDPPTTVSDLFCDLRHLAYHEGWDSLDELWRWSEETYLQELQEELQEEAGSEDEEDEDEEDEADEDEEEGAPTRLCRAYRIDHRTGKTRVLHEGSQEDCSRAVRKDRDEYEDDRDDYFTWLSVPIEPSLAGTVPVYRQKKGKP